MVKPRRFIRLSFLGVLIFVGFMLADDAQTQDIKPYQQALSEATVDSLRKRTFDEPQSSIAILRAQIASAPSTQNQLKSQLYGLLAQAIWHTQAYHIDSVLHYRRKSVEFARISGDSILLAESMISLGSMMRYQSNYAEGEKLIFKALKIIERRGGNEEKEVDAQNVLCNLCLGARDYEKAIDYGKRAENEARRLALAPQKSAAQLCVVRALSRSSQYTDATAYGQKIISEHEGGDTRDQMYMATIHAVLRTPAIRTGDTASAIRHQRILVEAELAQAKASQSYEVYYGARARLAIYEKRYADAIKDLAIYYPYLEKNFPDARLEHTGQEYSFALKKMGRYKEAYAIELRQRKRLERIHEKELVAARQELRDSYRAEEQEKQLAARALELEKQKTTTRWIIGLALALLASLVFVGLSLQKSYRQSKVLSARSEENERLLKEVHHRVKNNLEIVSSLLELQADKLTEPEANKAIQAGRSRILSIGLLHQKLYQDRAVGSVEMAGYLRDLTELLIQTYGSEKKVNLVLKLDPIVSDLEQALPVGLIVNELVTNAMKYAFNKDAQGTLEIGFQEKKDGKFKLWVADNGSGKQANKELQGTGFGSELIRLLTIQLGGKIQEVTNEGLKVIVVF